MQVEKSTELAAAWTPPLHVFSEDFLSTWCNPSSTLSSFFFSSELGPPGCLFRVALDPLSPYYYSPTAVKLLINRSFPAWLIPLCWLGRLFKAQLLTQPGPRRQSANKEFCIRHIYRLDVL